MPPSRNHERHRPKADGIYWVVDTNGGAILGFRLDEHGPHQVARLPVGARPYGIAYDERRSTLWGHP